MCPPAPRPIVRLAALRSHIAALNLHDPHCACWPCPAAASEAVITPEELAAHASAESCWVAVDGKVLDVTSFLAAHPGGDAIILKNAAGKDASRLFHSLHAKEVLARYAFLRVGRVAGAVALAGPPPPSDDFDGDLRGALSSAFPAGRLAPFGLEAVRFQWANASALTAPGRRVTVVYPPGSRWLPYK